MLWFLIIQSMVVIQRFLIMMSASNSFVKITIYLSENFLFFFLRVISSEHYNKVITMALVLQLLHN